MIKPSQETIEQATEEVKQLMPIEELRQIPKYSNISEEEYEELIKAAEHIALLAIETYILTDELI